MDDGTTDDYPGTGRTRDYTGGLGAVNRRLIGHARGELR
jgi:hypothetical protein